MTSSSITPEASPTRRPRPFFPKAATLVILAMLAATPVWAAPPVGQETSSEAIRKELERYRVLYTDNHPDVQMMERHLERALKLEAEQRAEARKKAEARKAREEARKAQGGK